MIQNSNTLNNTIKLLSKRHKQTLNNLFQIQNPTSEQSEKIANAINALETYHMIFVALNKK